MIYYSHKTQRNRMENKREKGEKRKMLHKKMPIFFMFDFIYIIKKKIYIVRIYGNYKATFLKSCSYIYVYIWLYVICIHIQFLIRILPRMNKMKLKNNRVVTIKGTKEKRKKNIRNVIIY